MRAFLLTLSLFFVAQTSMAFDITPQDQEDGRYVQVTAVGSGAARQLGFQLCNAQGTCRQLGHQESYSAADLQHREKMLNLKTTEKGVLDVAMIPAGIYGGGAAGVYIFTLGAGGATWAGLAINSIGGGFIGAGVGTTLAVLLDTTVKALNPFEEHRVAKALSQATADDQNSHPVDFDKFVQHLEEALD